MEKNKNSKLVYSTDPDSFSAEKKTASENNNKGATAYIERDKKQRKGKVVTVISNLSNNLKEMQKELQKECGAGGSLKNGNIEIQGDHREKVAAILQKKGIKTKFKGG